jgi:hypothetical protein
MSMPPESMGYMTLTPAEAWPDMKSRHLIGGEAICTAILMFPQPEDVEGGFDGNAVIAQSGIAHDSEEVDVASQVGVGITPPRSTIRAPAHPQRLARS